MDVRLLITAACLAAPSLAAARNIVLSNDDGLTSNTRALYEALKKQGHDVIVSVPCANQSGMGAAAYFGRALGPLASDCRNGAAKAGQPGAGPITRAGFEKDYFYVDGTPVMAMMYGIDVVAKRRWGKAPDLVLSGPNEGQNVGRITASSGTVSNAQVAGGRGLPAIALSAGGNSTGNADLANPISEVVATLSAQLVKALDDASGGKAMLPASVALNVNFPDQPAGAKWRITRSGTYDIYRPTFVEQLPARPGAPGAGLPGIEVQRNADAPRADQQDDEAVVYRTAIAVTVMQVGSDPQPAVRDGLAKQLRALTAK